MSVRDQRFEVQATKDGGVVVLSVRGALDAQTAPELAEEITAELSNDPTALIVDLSRVDALDSAGMGAVLRGHATAGDTRFAVVAEDPIIAQPMTVESKDLSLNVYPTLVAALVADTGGEGWL